MAASPHIRLVPKRWPRALLFSLLCVFGDHQVSVRAQEHALLADSLIGLLPTMRADSAKVFTYRDIAYYLQEEKPDSALHYARIGQKLARVIGLVPGQIWNLNQQGLAWEYLDGFDSAIVAYSHAHDLALQMNDPKVAGQMLNTIGAAYYYQGKFPDAIANYDKALEIFSRIGDDDDAAWSLNNLGVIYRIRRDHQKAIDIYERSLHLKQRTGDSLGMAKTHHNLGLVYSYTGDHERSLDHFESELKILHAVGNDAEINRMLVGRGIAYHMLGKIDAAVIDLEQALKGLTPRDVVEKASALLHLGLIDLDRKEATRGMARLREAHKLMEGTSRSDLLRTVEKELAKACDQLADPECASRHWRSYSLLSDSLADQQRQWAMEEMQARYESREKESTIRTQELALDEERAERKLYFVIGSLAILLLLASTVFGYSRVRLAQKLRLANGRAQEALSERELLLKEMHHRVKNNLQMLNSLLSIQSRELNDPIAREAMRLNKDRVQAIGLIHQFLYTRDAFRRIQMDAYINRLLEHLAQACEVKGRSIGLHAVTEEIELDVDLATPIGLIVNELVTNAIKHAFHPEQGGRITVTLRREKGGLLMQVEDDGIGATEHHDAANGFGHLLITTLCKKLGAHMEVSTLKGTLVTLHIPLKHAHEAVLEHSGTGR